MTPVHMNAGEALVGSYDYWLVALSVLIATGRLVRRARPRRTDGRGARSRRAWIWLAGGAVSMGLGIWSMHYIGMLAFTPARSGALRPADRAALPARRDLRLRRRPVRRQPQRPWTVTGVVAGSIVMGAGIAAMHYVGMAAMRLPAMCL